MAVLCLLGGLAAIVAAYVWPLAFTGLRLAHVRLNLFGFVGLTALGTLHVLLPTVFGAPDPKTPSRLRQDLPLAFGGVLAVACAGLLPAPFDSGALLLGLTLYGVCVLKLAGAWWAAYGAKLWRDGVAALLVGALGGLCVVLMVQAGEGGGELIAGAAVQIAFNFGNAVGSIVGGAALTATAMNYHYTGLAGAPIALIAVIMLVTYSRRYETHTGATERMREVHV